MISNINVKVFFFHLFTCCYFTFDKSWDIYIAQWLVYECRQDKIKFSQCYEVCKGLTTCQNCTELFWFYVAHVSIYEINLCWILLNFLLYLEAIVHVSQEIRGQDFHLSVFLRIQARARGVSWRNDTWCKTNLRSASCHRLPLTYDWSYNWLRFEMFKRVRKTCHHHQAQVGIILQNVSVSTCNISD